MHSECYKLNNLKEFQNNAERVAEFFLCQVSLEVQSMTHNDILPALKQNCCMSSAQL